MQETNKLEETDKEHKFVSIIFMLARTLRDLFFLVDSEVYYRSRRAVLERTIAKIAAFLIIIGIATCIMALMLVLLTLFIVHPTYLLSLFIGAFTGIAGLLIGWYILPEVKNHLTPPPKMKMHG